MAIRLSRAIDGYWLARRRNLSPNTVRDYQLTFDRLIAFLADPEFAAITAEDIHRYLNHEQSAYRLGNKTLSNRWVALSSLWTWAERDLQTPHIMRLGVPRPRYRRPPIAPYTESDIRALLDAVDAAAGWQTRKGRRVRSRRPTARRDRAIIIVLLDTGLRASELCDLTLGDYEQSTGKLTVRHGKGDKRRDVFLGETARRALWRYLVARDDDERHGAPLFAARSGKPIRRDNLLNTIVRIADRAGISNANVHRFRHTYAVNFLRNGGNLLELQRLLGHERMDTLHIYVTLAQSDLAEAQRAHSPADNWRL